MDAPRDTLYRARSVPPELRDADDDDPRFIGAVMRGVFTPFEEWTEINSVYEGRFLERAVPGAFAKTIAEQRDRMKVLFNHGRDPSIGDKLLGPIRSLVEGENGPEYEVPLYRTSYNADLLPGLQDHGYGASYRFRVIREEWVDRPKRSEHNPEGIPERTLREVAVDEFGPVTFPAYAGASAGVRSLTDHFRNAFILGTPSPDAALVGTSGDSAAEAPNTDAARSGHLGMSAEARARVLSL